MPIDGGDVRPSPTRRVGSAQAVVCSLAASVGQRPEFDPEVRQNAVAIVIRPMDVMRPSGRPPTSASRTFRNCRNVRLESGMRIEAEVLQPLWIYGVSR
jgi:hypothetical protein